MRHTASAHQRTFQSLIELSSAQCKDAVGDIRWHWPKASCTGVGISAFISSSANTALCRILALHWHAVPCARTQLSRDFPRRQCVDPVSKGARQGIIAIIISLVYLDDLLVELRESGIGCYWGSMFAGPFAYAAADDIVLLASSLAVPQL